MSRGMFAYGEEFRNLGIGFKLRRNDIGLYVLCESNLFGIIGGL